MTADDVKCIRSLAYVAGFFFLLSSVGQAQSPVPGVADLDLARWAITQGGLVLVTLILLWSYRRDFKTIQAEQKSNNEVLMVLVKDTSTAINESTHANRELAQAIMQWGREK